MITNYANNNINFSGYSARPIQAIVMRKAQGFDISKIADEMKEIGTKHGFDIILESRVKPPKPNKNTIFTKIKAFFDGESEEYLRPWIQDVLYFTKNKMLISKDEYINHTALCANMGLQREEIPAKKFISGGNLFLLKNGEEEKILIGEHEKVKKATALFPEREITRLPQADFHIDLFVRPLKNNTIVVADDDLTLEMLQVGKCRLEDLIKKSNRSDLQAPYDKLRSVIKNMQSTRKSKQYADTNDVISTLKSKGYEIIRTPGRIYSDKIDKNNPYGNLIHSLNFINAVVATDKNGELVYISNKTNFSEELGLTPELVKEIGLDFEAIFKKSVEDYIKPENIYFIKGGSGQNPKVYDNISQILKETHGGIHCLCAEIPKW